MTDDELEKEIGRAVRHEYERTRVSAGRVSERFRALLDKERLSWRWLWKWYGPLVFLVPLIFWNFYGSDTWSVKDWLREISTLICFALFGMYLIGMTLADLYKKLTGEDGPGF